VIRARSTLAILGALSLAVPAAMSPRSAWAQAGERPYRVILPVGAGSGVDTAVRAMSAQLATTLGQPVVIENHAGAGGIAGTQLIVRAPKDGRTFGFVANTHVVNPGLRKDMPYDAIEDVTPVMVIGSIPFVLLAHPSLPVRTLAELIALAKSRPGALDYGSSGTGTILHLASEMLLSEARIDMKHIPYRSAGQQLAEMIGGQVPIGFSAVSIGAQHVRAGKLRTLGLSTKVRSHTLPGVPTLAESGLPNYDIDGWFAAVGPAGLPDRVVSRIHSALKSTLENPQVRERMIAQGYTLDAGSPRAAGQYFRSELAKYQRLIKRAGIEPS
jgi:tripartite-type tricarboxylate transporter receptor subunit TctC